MIFPNLHDILFIVLLIQMPEFRVDHALLGLDLIDPIRSSFNCTVYTINNCNLIMSKKSFQFLPTFWLLVTVMPSLAVTGLSVHKQVVRAGDHNSTKPAPEKKNENWFKTAAFYNDFLENFHQMSIEQHHKCILVIRLWENWNFILLEIIFKVLNPN